MTKIEIHFKEDDIVYFEIKGHVGFSNFGTDIVCSAISSVLTMTINGIVEIAKLVDVKYTIEEGYANCNLKNVNKNELQKVYVLTQSMYKILEAISREYKKHVKLIIKEV